MTFEDWIRLPLTKQFINACHNAAKQSMRELASSEDADRDKKLKTEVLIYDRLSDLDGLKTFIVNPEDLNEGV